jgi:hypothetical protein
MQKPMSTLPADDESKRWRLVLIDPAASATVAPAPRAMSKSRAISAFRAMTAPRVELVHRALHQSIRNPVFS